MLRALVLSVTTHHVSSSLVGGVGVTPSIVNQKVSVDGDIHYRGPVEDRIRQYLSNARRSFEGSPQNIEVDRRVEAPQTTADHVNKLVPTVNQVVAIPADDQVEGDDYITSAESPSSSARKSEVEALLSTSEDEAAPAKENVEDDGSSFTSEGVPSTVNDAEEFSPHDSVTEEGEKDDENHRSEVSIDDYLVEDKEEPQVANDDIPQTDRQPSSYEKHSHIMFSEHGDADMAEEIARYYDFHHGDAEADRNMGEEMMRYDDMHAYEMDEVPQELNMEDGEKHVDLEHDFQRFDISDKDESDDATSSPRFDDDLMNVFEGPYNVATAASDIAFSTEKISEENTPFNGVRHENEEWFNMSNEDMIVEAQVCHAEEQRRHAGEQRREQRRHAEEQRRRREEEQQLKEDEMLKYYNNEGSHAVGAWSYLSPSSQSEVKSQSFLARNDEQMSTMSGNHQQGSLWKSLLCGIAGAGRGK